VTSGVLWGSIPGQVLFNIVIKDLVDGVECTLSMFADDTKQGGVADTAEDHVAIQRDLEGWRNWADRDLVKFSNGKRKVLHLGLNYPIHRCVRWEPPIWKAALQKRSWGS